MIKIYIYGKFRYKKHPKGELLFSELAGLPGLEPGYTESESVVLPLNYSPKLGAL